MTRTILIVDDSATDRVRLETLLTAAGYQVTRRSKQSSAASPTRY